MIVKIGILIACLVCPSQSFSKRVQPIEDYFEDFMPISEVDTKTGKIRFNGQSYQILPRFGDTAVKETMKTYRI